MTCAAHHSSHRRSRAERLARRRPVLEALGAAVREPVMIDASVIFAGLRGWRFFQISSQGDPSGHPIPPRGCGRRPPTHLRHGPTSRVVSSIVPVPNRTRVSMTRRGIRRLLTAVSGALPSDVIAGCLEQRCDPPMRIIDALMAIRRFLWRSPWRALPATAACGR